MISFYGKWLLAVLGWSSRTIELKRSDLASKLTIITINGYHKPQKEKKLN